MEESEKLCDLIIGSGHLIPTNKLTTEQINELKKGKCYIESQETIDKIKNKKNKRKQQLDKTKLELENIKLELERLKNEYKTKHDKRIKKVYKKLKLSYEIREKLYKSDFTYYEKIDENEYKGIILEKDCLELEYNDGLVVPSSYKINKIWIVDASVGELGCYL